MQLLGATTLDEYRLLEQDAALARRFQSVYVEEPNIEDTLSILRGLKPHYELHHSGIRIKDEALVAAANLSDRYISDRFQPDKAIDLIDEACSRLRLEQVSFLFSSLYHYVFFSSSFILFPIVESSCSRNQNLRYCGN